MRVPLFALLAAPFLGAGIAYPGLIIVHALLGALLSLVAYGLGRELFDARVGVWAAIATALNPYTVVHDPSFQDTVLFNVLIASSVLLLIVAVRRDRPRWFVAAGLVLALSALTTARLIVFLPAAIAWVAYASRGSASQRAGRAAMVAVPLVLLVGGWIARNAVVVGTPVLTTGTGISLWVANHELTMRYLPNRSIDDAEEAAWLALSAEQRRAVDALAPDHLAQSEYLGSLARASMIANPRRTFSAAVSKVLFGLGGWLSPARGWPIQAAFLLVFVPLTILAAIGLRRAWPTSSAHRLVALLVLSFASMTAIFWAHTSHASFLHLFVFVYAARVLRPIP